MSVANLTPARRRGLEAAARFPIVRRSNETYIGTEESLVYWQSADWLEEQGLVRLSRDRSTLTLTPAGVERCRLEGIAAWCLRETDAA